VERLRQADALLGWLDAAPAHDALIVVGDFNANPGEPASARMRSRLPSAFGGGRRRGAGGDLAERPQAPWTMTAIEPRLPIWLGDDRGRGAPGLRPAAVGDHLYPSDHLGIAARVGIGR
jgi:endonuclease/exonuclease/phosphatase family metal-dependent hydrolase